MQKDLWCIKSILSVDLADLRSIEPCTTTSKAAIMTRKNGTEAFELLNFSEKNYLIESTKNFPTEVKANLNLELKIIHSAPLSASSFQNVE